MQVIILDEVEKFLKGLDKRSRNKCRDYIKYLMHSGYQLRPPFSKNIMINIFELRIKSANNIRLIYSFHNNMAIIFHVFMKKTNRIENQDILIIREKYRSLQI